MEGVRTSNPDCALNTRETEGSPRSFQRIPKIFDLRGPEVSRFQISGLIPVVLGLPVVPFYRFFFGWGFRSPTKIDKTGKKHVGTNLF